MARWGEGDPRWLVEERPDATNVNNWHWTEKNASQWSKSKLEELFIGAIVTTDYGSCEITEMKKCEGDAVVNNRKAKLFFFYEWALEMKWTGELIHGDTVAQGTIEIPNLSEEHEIKDVDINILLDTPGPEQEVVKDMMRAEGCEVIRSKLSTYLASLKEEFSKGLILPTKDPLNTASTNESEKIKKSTVIVPSNVKSETKEVGFETSELHSIEIFKCTAEEFYRAMTIKELVQAFTRGDCTLEPEEGGKFRFFDGNVEGQFVKLVPNKLIKQKWRYKTWPDGHFSDVTLDIHQKSDCTEVNFIQLEIPKTELENTREGWKRFYFESMKRTFGFGALLF